MNLLETIKKVRSIRDNLTQDRPSELSEQLVTLATANAELGDLVGALKHKYEVERGELYRKYLNEHGSDGKAENLARAELAESRGIITQAETLHKDIARLISTIQSRLRSLEQESKSQF